MVVPQTVFTRRDAVIAAVGAAGSVVVSVFDESIADWWRKPSVQGSDNRQQFINTLSTVNEEPLTIGAFALYGVGRLTRATSFTGAALHSGEAIVLTVIASEVIRVSVGRARRRRSPDDRYNLGAGWNNFDCRAYPSIHIATHRKRAPAGDDPLHGGRSPGGVGSSSGASLGVLLVARREAGGRPDALF